MPQSISAIPILGSITEVGWQLDLKGSGNKVGKGKTGKSMEEYTGKAQDFTS